MIIRYMRWAHNLRCPKCDAVQPVFGLLSTLRGGVFSVALNPFAPCAACCSRLRLVHAHGWGWRFLVMVFIAALNIGLFVAVAVPLFFGSFAMFGLWAFLWIFLIPPLTQLVGLLPIRLLGPHYRKVVVI